jgi:hypothetical protein
MIDRRRTPRYRLTTEVTGKLKATTDVKLIDVSEGGLLVETELGIQPGSVCELKVFAKGSELTLEAGVRRCRAQLTKTDAGCRVTYRSGLEFTDLTDEQMAGVRRLILECCDTPDDLADAGVVTQGAVVRGAMFTV